MFATLDLDPGDSMILSALIVITWAVISFFCGRYGKEKGYSFWLCFLLCLLGQLIGLLAVLLLPDLARIRADAARRARGQDQEIAAGAPTKSPPAASGPAAQSDALAIFPARTEDMIACPRCGRRQKGNRDSCYACGLSFQYETE